MSISSIPSPNLFWGVMAISPSMTTNKIDYNFEFDPEPVSDQSYSYLQLNPISTMHKLQATNPTIKYTIIMVYWERYNCSATPYPYIVYQAQLCYDSCPPGKSPNALYQCQSCSECTNTTLCTSCYTSQCTDGYFFTNTTWPFGCITCSPTKSNCTKCSANLTGVYCIECDVASTTELVNGNCVTCNSSSYFSSSRVCTLCSAVLSDCQTCTSDGSTCLFCIIGSST